MSPRPDAPGPPPMPADADPALVEFISCHTDSIVLGSGQVTWLPMPAGVPSFLGHPTVSYGHAGEAVLVAVKWGFLTLKLKAKVVDGELHAVVDGRRSFGLRASIEAWVRDMNAHLAARGRRLQSIRTDGRTATIVKEPAPADEAQLTAGPAGTPPAGG